MSDSKKCTLVGELREWIKGKNPTDWVIVNTEIAGIQQTWVRGELEKALSEYPSQMWYVVALYDWNNRLENRKTERILTCDLEG